MVLCVNGVVYAAIIAFRQGDAKRLNAYSSIAHVGLIGAGVFAWNVQSLQGAIIQMVNDGISVLGLFFVVDILVRRLGKRDLAALGGFAKSAPVLGHVKTGRA